MANNNEEEVNLYEVSMKAMNISTRMKLSWFLNPEQLLFSTNGCARDYRGLAELMGFQHNDILNFQRHKDPTQEILNAWECVYSEKKPSIGQLVALLEKMERYDIVSDLKPQIISNVKAFANKELSKFMPLQVSEISSRSDPQADDEICLTIRDQKGEPFYYDAYVCYADNDLEFVKFLAQNLENNEVGIKLCIRDRDLCLGNLEYSTFVQLIQKRCQRILIVLSPDFLQTPECDYQAKYAASLASEHISRRIIPIIYKACEIPPILKYISKVDFTRPDVQIWIWPKLIASIRVPTTDSFVPPYTSQQALSCTSLALPSPPESSEIPSLPSVPSNDSLIDLAEFASPEGSENQYSLEKGSEKVALVQAVVVNRSSKSQKLVKTFRNFIGSSSSSASSGFHSQSDS